MNSTLTDKDHNKEQKIKDFAHSLVANSKVKNEEQEPTKTTNDDGDKKVAKVQRTDFDNQFNDKRSTFLKWIEIQTRLPNLILYLYLFWYIWIMIILGALFEFDEMDILTSFEVCALVGIALNAAAYQGPFSNYIQNPFKISKFFLIPLCVSSLSIGCTKSDACAFLIPTDTMMLTSQMLFQIAILTFGSLLQMYSLKKLKERYPLYQPRW